MVLRCATSMMPSQSAQLTHPLTHPPTYTCPTMQALDDRVMAAREAYLARRRAAGDPTDPFIEEERRQQKHAQHQPLSPAAQSVALAAAQQHHGGQQPAAGEVVGAGAAGVRRWPVCSDGCLLRLCSLQFRHLGPRTC